MRPVEDTYRHKGLRKKLVDIVRGKGITDEKVLAAIGSIPRHFFLDSAFDELAYEDRAFPDRRRANDLATLYGRLPIAIARAKTVHESTGDWYGKRIPGHGTGRDGSAVYTIERQRKLFDANKLFSFLKKYTSVKFFYGDGYEGLPTYAPFDRVIITAAAPAVPPKLIEQLKTGGMMVIPVGEEDRPQQMMRITKLDGGALKEEVLDKFSFVPMKEGKKG